MCVCASWLNVTDHDVEDHSTTPDVIRRSAVGDALQDLRGGVRCRAAERFAQLVRVLVAGEAEVGDLDVVGNIQQDVLTLQVPAEWI